MTPNSLELHKLKEQERRAREKLLLARLQVADIPIARSLCLE